MPTTIARQQQRRDTSARWAENNPVLAAGEVGYDTTLNRIKVGNGLLQWSALSFADEAGGAEAAQAAAEAAADAAQDAAMAASASALDAETFNAPASVSYEPDYADAYQLVGDDNTVYSLVPSGSSGPSVLTRSDRLVVTVTAVIHAPTGAFLGAAVREAPGPLPDDAGVFSYVRTSYPTAVTVVVSLPVDTDSTVEIVPVFSGAAGETFVNVGPASPLNAPEGPGPGTPGQPLTGYGPVSMIAQQV